ncbi:MAG: hypothetical protein ACJAR1_000617 [Rubritalea sp.]|jgi:hypothetical protein|tara:strand:- start:1244 stop:1831 length:588 start_codon:yes stop_codon:yes gene_type:complete
MKKIITLILAAQVCVLSSILVQTASAQQAVEAAKKAATTKITLNLPADTELNYKVKDKQFRILGEKTVMIPNNATNLKIPAGVVIKAVTSKPDGSSAEVVMTSTAPLNLSSFSPETIQSNKSKLTTNSVDIVRADGSKVSIDVAAGTVTKTSATGVVVTNTSAEATAAALEDAFSEDELFIQVLVNEFLEDTDGN